MTRSRTRRCASWWRTRSRRSRKRCSSPHASTTTASSTRATPAPCSACRCRSCTTSRSRGVVATASSGCERQMIRSLLVANRGEIARRVFRTAREMGITTVAVFSDPDADAPFVREADVAVRLPGASPTETYLRGDLVVEAAIRAGANAVHPGYGFLSENAGFAQSVVDAGLTWVGPPPSAIEAMGSKLGAKEMMRAAGVPTLPWAAEAGGKGDEGGGGRPDAPVGDGCLRRRRCRIPVAGQGIRRRRRPRDAD